MPTKLSRIADGLMEAAWLAAVMVVPVFFNIFSSRIFEPDKITLLRSLALLILAAWLVKLAEEGGPMLRMGRWRAFLHIPLVLPILALAAAYLVSTLVSLTPATSLWGSYQRLQGTYTTFSYLVIFAALAVNLRQRAQVGRLITVVIVASLPVSLYGILQRYRIDPVPWGGDVSVRIASNLGNSIFLAAYLIMVFPLTAARIVDAFAAILRDRGNLAANFSRATIYIFIAALQLIAVYFTGSRGPWLGLLAGSFFLLVVLSLLWRKRWLTLGVVGSSLAVVGFLALLNIPGGPLESLRARPELNRLGQVFDAESRTGRVRSLIWEGASRLVRPHDPLVFPDGRRDPLNLLRPLIGYGPESMYVVYNPFYPPALTQVEKRNATPDRSHNETWDSLVITGALGLAGYLALFLSVFYWGLKWIGLIQGKEQRNLFLGLTLAGGAVSAAGFVLWQGPGYFGVGLPFGIVSGLFIYLVLAALAGRYQPPADESGALRSLVLLGLLAAIVAHFVEVNFGIAIAATRLYFWVFTALLFVVGWRLPGGEAVNRSVSENGGLPEPIQPDTRRSFRKKGRSATRAAARPADRTWPGWLREALVGGVLLGILLATLGYDFLSDSGGGETTLTLLWTSLTRVKTVPGGVSFGMLIMVLTAWLGGGVLLASEGPEATDRSAWVRSLVVLLAASMLFGLIFWLLHSAALASLMDGSSSVEGILGELSSFENILTRYYIYLLLLLLTGAVVLAGSLPGRASASPWSGPILAPLALVVVFALVAYTNLRIIQADIIYKLGDPFARSGQWLVTAQIYERARELAPSEDYYHLFLGRAYLEQARAQEESPARETVIRKAEAVLLEAQQINPLNTDHTANLARMYSTWAGLTTPEDRRRELAETAGDYFATAVRLSPNNARLWDEWGVLHLNLLEQPQEAYDRLAHALEVDPHYDWTHGLLGDFYTRQAQAGSGEAGEERRQALQKAAEHYDRALALSEGSDLQLRYGYALALGGVHSELGQPQQAIGAYERAAGLAPQNAELWRLEEAIARLYAQEGQMESALLHAQNALAGAPEDQKERLQILITQITGQS